MYTRYTTQLDYAVIVKNLSFFQRWFNVSHVAGLTLDAKEIKKNTVPSSQWGEELTHE